MCGHCNAEDARVCEECGALIAFEWQPEHKAFHERVTALADAMKPVLVEIRELRINGECSNCGKAYSEPACGPGHAMADHERKQG